MLHYSVCGEGPTLVLVHGFLESITMWNDYLPKLSQRFKVITIDLPGHGKSSIDKDETIASMAEKLKSLLDKESVSDYVLVGHSMGSYVGAELCKIDQRVRHLILLNSHLDEDTDDKKRMRTKVADFVLQHYAIFVRESVPGLFYSKNIPQNQAKIDAAIDEALTLNPSAISTCTKAMRDRKSNLEWAKTTSTPITFITGDQDGIMPLEMIKAQHSILEKSELIVLKNCGHMAHIEASDQALKEIIKCIG